MANTQQAEQSQGAESEEPAQSASDNAGTNYQTTYTYFYVPADIADPTSSADDSGLGAFIRLGEYSDIEEESYTNGDYEDYYPAEQVREESGDDVYKKAAGGSKGILLSCEGRMLVKSGEKLFINADDDINIESSGGAISITSGTDGDGKPQDILISAANGKGNVTQKYYKSTITVEGEDYEKVTSVSRKYYEANKYEIYHADSFKEVYANTTSIQHGGNLKYFMGGTVSLKLAGEFNLALAAVLDIAALTKFAFWGVKFDCGILKIDFCSWKMEVKEGKVSMSGSNFKAKAVKVDTSATSAKADGVAVQSRATEANANAVEAKTGNVKALIALWEAKIASTAQI